MLARQRDLPLYDSAELRIPFIFEIRELVRYRFLLWNVILRDLRIRYKRSFLGILWAMVNPLLTMMVLTVVFSTVFRFQVEHYPSYLLSGLLLWNLFSRGTSAAMRSVLDNTHIRRKIYVPASVFVAASIGGALIHLLFALIPLILLALATGVPPSLAWFFLPIPILGATLLAFGIGLAVAALAVFFADVIDIYEVLLNILFYITPIIYPISILPAQLARLQGANPFYHFVHAFRAALIDGDVPDPALLLVAIGLTFLLTAAGWTLFTRLSDRFAYLT